MLVPLALWGAPQGGAVEPGRGVQVQATESAGEPRIALVIGNSGYQDAPLKNPVNDARAVRDALARCGFAVTELENASRSQMREAIRSFGARIAEGGVGLFYFAGHGMQVKGRNFLIPVGADIAHEDEVAGEAVEVDAILAKMDTAKNRLNILVLDACRNNPFGRSFRSTQQGLAQVDAPTGTFVAFATAPGRTAADGSGAHGIYTAALLNQLQAPGQKLEDVFKRTRAEVLKASSQQQTPWENSSIIGDFYFVPGAPAAPAPTHPTAAIPPPISIQADRAPDPTPEERDLLAAMHEKGLERVLKLAKPLAAKGSVYGRFAIGYMESDQPTRNRAIAEAAKTGIPMAMVEHGRFLLEHPLSPAEVAEARAWLDRALALGEPDAMYTLGIELVSGKHFPRDLERAERLFAQAAQANVGYYYGVGCLYWNDEECRAAYTKEEADAKGLAFLRRGAEIGDLGSMSMLSGAYQSGHHAPKDSRRALRWHLEAADHDPNPYWTANVGRFYRDVDDPTFQSGKDAIRWFTKASERGDAAALGEMAKMYREGHLVPKDLPKAVLLYRKAADKGQMENQRDLGEMYEKGLGVPRDLAQAYFWYMVAGDFGSDGRERLDGLLPGAERTRIGAQALAWRKARAADGSPEDQFELGEIYKNGLGVSADLAQAYFWYVLAGDKHHGWTWEREHTAKLLPASERARIEAQARRWKPTTGKKAGSRAKP